MPKYRYILKDENGKKREGVIFSVNHDTATEQIKEIRQPGEFIISVFELQKKKFWAFGGPSLKIQDKMLFIRSLATMFKVGITLIESMEIITDQAKSPIIKKMYEDIQNMIRSGQTLSKSLAKYNKVFSEITINMIATGEENGNLDEVLDYISEQLEKEYELRKKVVSALVYPVVILSVTLLMAIGIVVFVMPKITRIFSTFKVDLPLPTQLLINITNLLTQQTVWVLLVTGAFIVTMVILLRLDNLKPFWHEVYLKFPVIGKILISANIARFSRTFNSLLRTGTPITKCMQVLEKVFTNVVYKKALQRAAAIIEHGGKIGEALGENEKLFPQMVSKMIFIGEKTGSLIITTEHIARMYEMDVDNKTKNLSTLMEPLLLVFMATLVGGIAMSIILPIYQLPNMIHR